MILLEQFTKKRSKRRVTFFGIVIIGTLTSNGPCFRMGQRIKLSVSTSMEQIRLFSPSAGALAATFFA